MISYDQNDVARLKAEAASGYGLVLSGATQETRQGIIDQHFDTPVIDINCGTISSYREFLVDIMTSASSVSSRALQGCELSPLDARKALETLDGITTVHIRKFDSLESETLRAEIANTLMTWRETESFTHRFVYTTQEAAALTAVAPSMEGQLKVWVLTNQQGPRP